jgi:hypothetical protein
MWLRDLLPGSQRVRPHRLPRFGTATVVAKAREALTEATKLRETQGRHQDADTRIIYDAILRRAVPAGATGPGVALPAA